MEITEVRVKLSSTKEEKLLGYCTVTFDNEFVIRDLKIIQGSNGYFIAMPTRRLTGRCPGCKSKNHLLARFCNQCGSKQPQSNNQNDDERSKLHAEIAHPINVECRKKIEAAVLKEFEEETKRANKSG